MRLNKGYTLVETMIAMSIMTMVLLSAGTILYISRQQFNAGTKLTKIQQDQTVITELLQNKISQAVARKTYIYPDYLRITGNGTPQGSCLKLILPDNTPILIYKKEQDLVVEVNNTSTCLVKNSLDSLWFSRSVGSDSLRLIKVKIKLASGHWNISTTQSYFLRN